MLPHLDVDSDTDISSVSELQAELTATTDPESPMSWWYRVDHWGLLREYTSLGIVYGVESNTSSSVEEATEEATVSVTGDYLEEPMTRVPEEPSTSTESDEVIISALV